MSNERLQEQEDIGQEIAVEIQADAAMADDLATEMTENGVVTATDPAKVV